MVRRLALATLFAAAMVRSGHSQEVTGEVEGWVVREPGTPLANVEVSASGSSLQGVRSVLSDGRGYFRIPALPVGSYWVRFRLIGYRPATYENVRIRLATTTSLGRVHLEAQTVELPELIVSGVATPIDPTTAANRATLTSEQLAELPVDRNFRSSLALLPQANTSYYGDEVNIAGSTGLENIYYVDGINVTDPSNAATSTNLPYNFVQEIELSTGGYEAEYGRALGGIVNVVTPSG